MYCELLHKADEDRSRLTKPQSVKRPHAGQRAGRFIFEAIASGIDL
jgi:hypothetical protein